MHTLLTRIIDFFVPPTPEALYIRALHPDTLAGCVLPKHTRTRHAYLPYREPLVRLLVQQAKFHNNHEAAVLLGKTLAPHIAELLGELRSFNAFTETLLVPVPLHKKRIHERGFNQSERIAKALLAELADEHTTLSSHVLVRHVYTQAQTQQHSRADRLKNLHEAFSTPVPRAVFGKDILLLDDVVTTGATLSSAKRALIAHGAHKVVCVAVAH